MTANIPSYHLLSADGKFVAFDSAASDLVDGDTNGVSDVFVFDDAGGVLQRLTDGNGSSIRPNLGARNGPVTFESLASNLVGPNVDTNGQSDVSSRTLEHESRTS
ncbi:MAG: hypothetical protein U1E76_11870 [Planctomycetota bacterium]